MSCAIVDGDEQLNFKSAVIGQNILPAAKINEYLMMCKSSYQQYRQYVNYYTMILQAHWNHVKMSSNFTSDLISLGMSKYCNVILVTKCFWTYKA